MANWFHKLLNDILVGNPRGHQPVWPDKPAWVVLQDGTDEEILEHHKRLYKAHYLTNSDRILRMRLNLFAYIGMQHFSHDVQLLVKEGLNPRYIGRTPKITSNKIQGLVDQQVASVLQVPNDIAIVPATDSFESAIHAEIIKELLDTYDYERNFKREREKIQRQLRIFGESYRQLFWNDQLGGLHPIARKRKQEGKPVKIENEKGELITIDKPIMQGDLDSDVPLPWDVGLDPKVHIKECQWWFRRKARPTEEVRFDHADSDAVDQVAPTQDFQWWQMDLMETQHLREHTLEVTFLHKSTPYLPEGRKVVITESAVLVNEPLDLDDLPHSELGNIGVERITDADVDGMLYGWSRLQNIDQLQNQYDNANTLIGQNIFIGARPKWMLPRGSANIKRLANKSTVVPFSGPIAPQLVTFPTVSGEVFKYQENVERDMEKGYRVFPISQGETPKGVTANAALQFLDLQQQEAISPFILKEQQFTVDSYRTSLAIIKENYDPSDERVITFLGDNQEWLSKQFDPKALETPVKVMVQVSSDLPIRKDARMQTIFQMAQIWPNVWNDERVIHEMKLGNTKRFLNAARASLQSAELENYKASRGQTLEEPRPYENLEVHWEVHRKQAQMPQFHEWPEKRKEELIEHLGLTEFLMVEKAQSNTLYGQVLLKLGMKGFPLVLRMAEPTGPRGGFGLPLPGPQGEQGSAPTPAQPASNAGVSQQRFPNGKFGQAVQPVQ